MSTQVNKIQSLMNECEVDILQNHNPEQGAEEIRDPQQLLCSFPKTLSALLLKKIHILDWGDSSVSKALAAQI